MTTPARAALGAKIATTSDDPRVDYFTPEFHFVVGGTLNRDGTITFLLQEYDDVGFGEHVTVYDHDAEVWRSREGEHEDAANEVVADELENLLYQFSAEQTA